MWSYKIGVWEGGKQREKKVLKNEERIYLTLKNLWNQQKKGKIKKKSVRAKVEDDIGELSKKIIYTLYSKYKIYGLSKYTK